MRLSDNGWPDRTIETLAYQKLNIRGNFKNKLFNEFEGFCRKRRYINSQPCRDLTLFRDKCLRNPNSRFYVKRPGKTILPRKVSFYNNGRNMCEYLLFQAALSSASFFDIHFDLFNKLKVVDPSKIANPDPHLIHTSKRLFEAFKKEEAEQSKTKRSAFRPTTRSLHTLYHFLGNLVRHQLRSTPSWTAKYYPDENFASSIPLFEIQKGSNFAVSPVISIHFYGTSYHVTRKYQKQWYQPYSLDIVRFVRFLQDQAFSKAKLPASNTFIVR